MNESNEKQSSNREVKSSVFTTYFSDPENAAQLYSALDGSQAGPEDIEYTTLEGVLLKLSDSYIEKTNTPMLELLVKVIYINPSVGHAILERCKPLYEYSWFIQKVKEHTQTEPNRDAAITQAIQDCIRAGIFADFVQKHGSEVVNMLFTQFNLEDAKKIWYEEAFEDGEERGLATGLATGRSLNLIELVQRKLRKGKTPENIADELEEPLKKIEQICAAVEKCGLDADPQEIFDEMENMAPVQ